MSTTAGTWVGTWPTSLLYDDSLRALHARGLSLGERFEDLFSEEGTRAFTSWLEGPAPWGAAHGINRYVFYRVARERPDVLRAYPDLDGADGAGYVDWCWTFGRSELGIPDRFMPPAERRTPARPSHGTGAGPAPSGASRWRTGTTTAPPRRAIVRRRSDRRALIGTARQCA